MPLVVDASMTLAWTLPDEEDAAAQRVFERVLSEGATAPFLWSWEVQNALRMAERRNRIDLAQANDAVANLRGLGVELQPPATLGRELELARRHELTVYDASYLELAIRLNLALATADRRLAAVARRLDILALECAAS
ncbi:MAG: type II toxin-antitoxin system VapC family toxin [Vulcanimicrobiaceae bacterium]